MFIWFNTNVDEFISEEIHRYIYVNVIEMGLIYHCFSANKVTEIIYDCSLKFNMIVRIN